MTRRIEIGLLAVVLAMMGLSLSKQWELKAPSAEEIAAAIRADRVNLTIGNRFDEKEEAILVVEWTDINGFRREVRTSKGEPGFEDETEEQFQDRHEARVQAQLKRYPKP